LGLGFPLLRGMTYQNTGIAPEYPDSGLLLHGLDFGPVQPYYLKHVYCSVQISVNLLPRKQDI